MGLIGGVVTGALSLVNPAAGLALRGAKAVVALAKGHAKAAVIIGAGTLIVFGFLMLKSQIRHRDKTIAAQAALIKAVKAEVDRGVGKPTEATDAAVYVRAFVDNLAAVKAALARQSAALGVAHREADAHRAAAAKAGKKTAEQERRDSVRQRIADPARTTGLTVQEWGQL
jgi:hypothetical protein